MIEQGRDILLALPCHFPFVADVLQVFAERLVNLL
jgi:hypothetical protein